MLTIRYNKYNLNIYFSTAMCKIIKKKQFY